MKSYASFCPVAKTAEIFAERWTPLLLREMCMGVRRFSELQQGLPQISRALLAQRLREMEEAGIIEKTPSREYRLTAAGEAFRPIIDMMAAWGQAHGRGRIALQDTDPAQLIWGLRRHMNMRPLPEQRLVIQFEFSGVPKAFRHARYWWMVLRQTEIDVCQKNPGYDVDVTIAADLQALTEVWLGHRGLAAAQAAGEIMMSGSRRHLAIVREALGLHDQPWQKKFDFSSRADPFGPPLASDIMR